MEEEKIYKELERVKNTISKSRIEESLLILKQLISKNNLEESYTTEILHLSHRYYRYISNSKEFGKYSPELNRIVISLIDLVRSLEKEAELTTINLDSNLQEGILKYEKTERFKWGSIVLTFYLILFFLFIKGIISFLVLIFILAFIFFDGIFISLTPIYYFASFKKRKEFNRIVTSFEKREYESTIEEIDSKMSVISVEYLWKAYFYRGYSNLYLKKYEEAIRDFSTIIQYADSDTYSIAKKRGWCYYMMEKNTKAILDLEIAIKLDYDLIKVFDLKEIYEENDMLDRAINLIDYALKRQKKKDDWRELNLLKIRLLEKLDKM